MKANKNIKLSQAGNAILSSIMMAGIVAGAATVAYKNFNTTYSSTRVARIKSKQAIVEAQVRRRALQPDAYVECNSSNLATCRVNGDYFADLGNQKVVGSQCGGQNSVCGVAARNVQINPATRVFSAEVAYEGTDVKLKPLSVNLEIPVEVLQAPRFHCGEKDKSKPIFTGFDSAGAPICEGFEACPPGKFVKGVDVSKRKLICQDLPSRVACGSQKMFSRLAWNGGSVDSTCSDLPDPPFTSRLSTRQVASTKPGDSNTRTGTETLTNTDTSTVTATATDTGNDTVTATATGTDIATSTQTDANLTWKYVAEACADARNGGVPGPSAPYTTLIVKGTGADSQECVRLAYTVDDAGMPADSGIRCPSRGATCDTYVNNHPPGMFSEGRLCWVCR